MAIAINRPEEKYYGQSVSNSEFRPLHEINPLRLGYMTRQLPLAGKTVLDIGCGGGILAEAMARQGALGTYQQLGYRCRNLAEGIAVGSAGFIARTQGERGQKHIRPRPFLEPSTGPPDPDTGFYATRVLRSRA